VVERLKREGLSRRGGGKTTSSKKARRRKTRSKAARATKATRGTGSQGEELLSLQRIKEITGISYPTLLRYVKLHLDKIPHVGSGRKRRYPREAVDVFVELRKNSPRGRKPKSGRAAAPDGSVARLEKKITDLQRSQTQLERQVRQLAEVLRKPLTVTLRR